MYVRVTLMASNWDLIAGNFYNDYYFLTNSTGETYLIARNNKDFSVEKYGNNNIENNDIKLVCEMFLLSVYIVYRDVG